MEFEGHIPCWYIYGYTMINKVEVIVLFDMGFTCGLYC